MNCCVQYVCQHVSDAMWLHDGGLHATWVCVKMPECNIEQP